MRRSTKCLAAAVLIAALGVLSACGASAAAPLPTSGPTAAPTETPAPTAEAAAEHRAQRRARNKVKKREPLFPAVPVFSWVFRAERV